MGDQADLADRVRAELAERAPAERKMFGGVCFMINGNMVAGTVKGDLLVRVGKDGHAAAMRQPHTRPMEQAGRVAAGYVIVAATGVARDRDLRRWLDTAVAHVEALPAKEKSPPRGGKRRAKGGKK